MSTACVPVLEGGTPPGLAARCLALAVGGRAGPDRLARHVRELLDHADPVTAELVAGGLGRVLPPVPAAQVTGAARRLARAGAVVHAVGHPGYPARLAQAWPELGAPLWLFARPGAGALPDGPAVAVVGTRHPTLDGLEVARELGRLLARHGVAVVSGLARGIDQAAHAGALQAGGATVGVLGTGFDVDYPRGDAALREEVARCGGLVTELAPGAGPKPRHFLWRNRIIAGLADATVVVEGRRRSGSLQTARLAAAQGRDVWAAPGSLNAPTSRGPLALVRDGARVLTQLEDVLESVACDPTGGERAVPGSRGGGGQLAPASRVVLDLLGAVPATVSALARAADLPLPAVMAAVADLTGRGLARTAPAGVVRGPGAS